MNEPRDYRIVSRWFVKDTGWVVSDELMQATTMQKAWAKATQFATALDEQYGSDHFWTVDLTTPEGESYVQLFHGRLS